METTFGQTFFSTTAKTLLAKLRIGDLTKDEFLKECGYWALKDGFDEVKPLFFPNPPTTPAFNEYSGLTPERRAKIDTSFFLKNPEIIEHYAKLNYIRHINKANLGWLLEMQKYVPQEDTPTQERITERIKAFTMFVDEENRIIEEAKEIFGGKEL